MKPTNKVLSRVIVLVASLIVASGAAAAPLRVTVLPADGCPSQAAVEAELAHLLPVPPASVDSADIVVADGGDRFAVTVCGAARVFVDPARTCAERARIAAVTLAVTLAPPTVSFAESASEPVAVAAGQPTAVTIARPAAPRPRERATQFLLSLDLGSAYRNIVGEQSYGVGEFDVQLGLERARWTFAARATLTYGSGLGNGKLGELALGPAIALKLGRRLRLGLTAALGIGWANWPPSQTVVSGMLIAVNTDVSVDLYRSRPHTLYAVLSPGVTVWTERELFFGGNVPNGAEFSLRLGLGYRFNH